MLQRGVVCCSEWPLTVDLAKESRSVLQCVAVCCSVLQCVAVCCSALQCFAVLCSVLHSVNVEARLEGTVCCRVLQSVAVLCSVL